MTLGGLLAFRGVVWVLSGGTTVAPDDATFVLIGGGPAGSLGGTMSWVLGIVICVAVVYLLVNARRQRRKFGFALRPMWAEVLLGTVGCAFVLGAVWVANSYHWPAGLASQFAKARGITEPPGGLQIEAGIPWPLVIVIGVGIVMTFLAKRRRFGRNVFAYGGNPDAAELAGINTRWTIMKTFILMGVLCAISAAIASARLNGGTLDLGPGLRAVRDRRGGHRRHVVRRRDRHDPRGDPRRPRHAVAGLRAELHGDGLADPEHRRRDRPGRRGRHRLVQSTACGMTAAEGPNVSEQTPLVEMRNINVAFGGVHAVRDVTIDLHAGEVVGLVGGNGAGKSTLMRVLSGAHRADSGEILINGEPSVISNPRDAKAYGIETIYQTLALADNLDAPANLFLGRELVSRFGSLDDDAMEDATRKVMGRLNPNFQRFTMPVKSLSGGQRQAVAIARAVHFNARILIMDEPTAALGPAETAQVRNLVRQLKTEGIGIFLISHDIHDVYDLADRVSVMYHGRIVDTVSKADVTTDEILGMIILGKKPGEVTQNELAALELRGLTRNLAAQSLRNVAASAG